MKERLKIRNKQHLLRGLLILVFFSTLHSCSEPEPFSIIPRIYFENLNYYEFEENGSPDSLILYFRFEDGDGNLGIQPSEAYPPFHDFDLIVDNDGRVITLGQEEVKLPTYLVTPLTENDPNKIPPVKYSDEDDRPPFNCIDYDTL